MKLPALSTKLLSKLNKIFWITIAWTIISISQFIMGYNTLLDFNCDTSSFGDPSLLFKGSILTGVLAGIIGGSAMVFLWERWLRAKPYGAALIHIFLSYSIVFIMVSIPLRLFIHSNGLGLSIFHSEVWQKVFTDHLQLGLLFNYVFWMFIVLGTLFLLLVNDKYGPGVLMDFLLGKYFHPKREERIFMFLDLRSSTTIAEQLGEEKYFNFLNDVFRFATESILHTKGEIYQYVGDEIVISWRMRPGIENANCIACFYAVQKALRKKTPYFKNAYGVVPEFKAGLHYGYVMTGEIGVIKRDIAFSGDVLNTAARIQGKCNELGVNILLSKFLLDKLKLPAGVFDPKMIGNLLLRGKQEKVVLYTV